MLQIERPTQVSLFLYSLIMASGEEEALSDLEDDAPPVILPSAAGSLKSVLAELETEKQARKTAEAAKAELVMRFKTYSQDTSRQKEELIKQRDETLRSKEELTKQLHDVIRQRDEIAQNRDEAFKVKDELSRQRDEAIKARDSSRSEIEAAARLLVEGAEKITSRISSIKNLPGNLPRSSSYTGVASIAYGYTKRAEDIVDEMVRLHEVAQKNRAELREQMEQHNYQMAIEVSEMEATIHRLKDDLTNKTLELEKFKKLTAEKEGRALEMEQEMSNKLSEAMKQVESSKRETQELKHKLEKMKDVAQHLTVLLSKGNEAVANLVDHESLPAGSSSKKRPFSSSNLDEPAVMLQECLDKLKELLESCSKVGARLREYRETKTKEVDRLEASVMRLTAEKKEITAFLRSALANKHEASDALSDRELSMEGKGKVMADDVRTGEVIGMASALENEVRRLRQEIFELQQSLASARGEVEGLRAAMDRQAKELALRSSKIGELEEKQSAAEDQIEGLNMDLAAAQEDILRWKQAATREAEAGAAVLEEVERCQEENAALKKQMEHLSQSLEESNSKLQSKEEMTAAAIAARNAAERSLRIADERAVELRERIEELNRQFDALERVGDGGLSSGLYNLCWPHQWFRRPFSFQSNGRGEPSAEMGELSEPLVQT